jgi:hypothetical protein
MNKKLIRLTEADLHRIVKESVNRILTESKNSKRYRQKAIQVAAQILGRDVADPSIENFVRNFENNLIGCSDSFYRFLPKFIEIALNNKEDYSKVVVIATELCHLARYPEAKQELDKISIATNVRHLENIINMIMSRIRMKRKKDPFDDDPFSRDIY